MQSAEGHFIIIVGLRSLSPSKGRLVVNPFELLFRFVHPPNKPVLIIKQQLPIRLPILRHQPRIIPRIKELLAHLAQVHVADNVDIMHQNGFGILEKRRGLYDAAARVHQLVAFVRNLDDSIELAMRYKINDLFAKMMHVDDNMIKAVGNQILDAMLQQRLAVEWDQSLGLVLGECFEAGAQASGQNHCGGVDSWTHKPVSSVILRSMWFSFRWMSGYVVFSHS